MDTTRHSETAGGDAERDRLREQTTSELLHRLSSEASLLVRQEVELAKAEIGDRGRTIGEGAGMLGAGALFGLGAFGALTAFLILVLSLAVAAWIAALVVAVVYGAIAWAIVAGGRQKIGSATPLAPQTQATLKEEAQWVKTRLTSEQK